MPAAVARAVLRARIRNTELTASASQNAWQHEASTLYANGDYGQAYKQYLKLGKQGDRFSAYRVSYMSLKGQGTKQDVIESLAWAVLAAFGQDPRRQRNGC